MLESSDLSSVSETNAVSVEPRRAAAAFASRTMRDGTPRR
jgi:hypothetical protein